MAKSRAKAADDELELIDDEPEAKSTKKNKAKAAAPAPEPKAESTGYGAAWLAEYINEELGTDYTAANVRVILRKMANDGDLEREVGTDRARYQFSGEKDPTVRAVLKRIKNGEVETDKAEKLANARNGRKAKAEPVEEDEPKAKKAKRKATVADEADDEAPKSKARRKRGE